MPDILHLLFVDDNPGDRELAREALGKGGTNIVLHTACDGLEALDFLRRKGNFKDAPRPHLVMLDINMPIRTGLETLKEIKEDTELKSIPVVVFSSSTAPIDLHLAYAYRANAYIVKPAELDDFLRTVRRIVAFWHTTAVVAA